MNKRDMIEAIGYIIEDSEVENKNLFYYELDDEDRTLRDIKEKIKKFKVKYEYLDKYGLDLQIDNIDSSESILLSEEYANIRIARVDRISNSFEQPNNEILMVFSHATGSYMFGGGVFSDYSYYDDDLFDMYFEELKTYKYSYIDEINQKIYFTIEEGIKLYNDYGDICKKYQKLFNERLKIDKKNKLKSQLEKMEIEDDEYES